MELAIYYKAAEKLMQAAPLPKNQEEKEAYQQQAKRFQSFFLDSYSRKEQPESPSGTPCCIS